MESSFKTRAAILSKEREAAPAHPDANATAGVGGASLKTQRVTYAESEFVFRQSLETYINVAVFSVSDRVLSLVSPQGLYRKHAATLIQSFRKLLAVRASFYRETESIHLSPYVGSNRHVHRMAAYLQASLGNYLTAACVHGSLGDYREMPYSDFDGLVVLKREVFDSPDTLARVAFSLRGAQSIMYQFDPLQHHGWFVLVDTDLALYPDYYLPVEVLRRSKSLLSSTHLKVAVAEEIQLGLRQRRFSRLSAGIIRRITSASYPRNIYQLKSFLSQIMLLPACFIQALEQTGISKEQSFDLARAHFNRDAWAIMDEVSQIRQKWHLPVGPRTSLLRLFGTPRLRFLAKRFAPSIPMTLQGQLNAGFYQRVENLVRLMISRITSFYDR